MVNVIAWCCVIVVPVINNVTNNSLITTKMIPISAVAVVLRWGAPWLVGRCVQTTLAPYAQHCMRKLLRPGLLRKCQFWPTGSYPTMSEWKSTMGAGEMIWKCSSSHYQDFEMSSITPCASEWSLMPFFWHFFQNKSTPQKTLRMNPRITAWTLAAL